MSKSNFLLVPVTLLLAACNTLSPSPSPTPTPSPTPLTESSGQSIRGTIEDLLAKNTPLTCDYSSQTESGDQIQGQVFVAEGDYRANSTVTSASDNQDLLLHVLRTDGQVYFWTDGQSQGYQVKEQTLIDVGESLQGLIDQDDRAQGLTPLQQNLDYTCRPWQTDTSLFTLPQDQDFQDLTSLIQNLLPNQ